MTMLTTSYASTSSIHSPSIKSNLSNLQYSPIVYGSSSPSHL